jgi:hypothetical protein
MKGFDDSNLRSYGLRLVRIGDKFVTLDMSDLPVKVYPAGYTAREIEADVAKA